MPQVQPTESCRPQPSSSTGVVHRSSQVRSVVRHRDVVRCVALCKDKLCRRTFLATGSDDCTVMVWEVSLTQPPMVTRISWLRLSG